jgi:hypothetical protein
MVTLNPAHLLCNHINRVLRAAIRNDWDDRCINDAEIFDAMDTELRIDNSLLYILGKTSSTTRIYTKIC